MDPSQAPNHETIELEKIVVQIVQQYDSLFFNNTKVEIENTVRGMMIKLRHEIYGQHDYQRYSVKFDIPLNWWECFKQDNMPKWYLKKFPVKKKQMWRTVEFDHKKIFPESTIKFPKSLGPVVFHSQPMDPEIIGGRV